MTYGDEPLCLMKRSARNAENVMASGTRIGSLNK
jgi:hypothetical protein